MINNLFEQAKQAVAEKQKPIVKLLTLWVYDYDRTLNFPHEKIISMGVWETIEAKEECISGKVKRSFTLRCVMPFTEKLSLGSKRTMSEKLICALCHQVELKHLPKIPEEIWDL